MECPKCNRTYEDDFKFCPYCGEEKPKPKICPKCKLEPPIEFSFCPECGEKLVTQDELTLKLKNMVNTSSLTKWEKEYLMKEIKKNEINENKLASFINNPDWLKEIILLDWYHFVYGEQENIVIELIKTGDFDELDDFHDVLSIIDRIIENPIEYGYCDE